MGLLTSLKDIGQSLLSGALQGGQQYLTQTFGNIQPGGIPNYGNLPQVGSGGFISMQGGPGQFQQPITGYPPQLQPGGNGNGTVFPDIPYVPDLGDVQQFFQGGFGAAMNGNGQAFGGQGLIPQQTVVQPMQKVINKAPRGYVIVDMPDGSGKKAVLKPIARKLGLWKPRKKPPVSVGEYNAIKKADRAKKKIKRVAEKADFKCRTKAQEARRRAKKK